MGGGTLMNNSKIVSFSELSNSDLKIGTTYEGGTKGNTGDDPLSKLMGCENQGGFRPVGARNGSGTKFCVIYSDLSNVDWPNKIETETGRFIYYGDNKKPDKEIHDTPKKGNLILRYSYDQLHKGKRKDIPPFFVFTKGSKGRDVVFRGLAVPGAAESIESENLSVVQNKRDEGAIQNYKAVFTLLDIPTISRSWIEDLHNGENLTDNAPKAYVNWVELGKYQPLKEQSTAEYLIFNSNPKYWLFNVFYAEDPFVWKKSKELGVAAMQYEYGRENNSSVTRHINLIKKISIGDYIVAYTGKKGFLGYGKVDQAFFEEGDPQKFINATGANWKQRVGVNWTKDLDTPVLYGGSKFIKEIGVIGNSVMGSSTIFEITEDGFNFTKRLIDGAQPIKIKEKPKPLLTQKEVVNHIHSYITSKGFNYSKEEVTNLFLSIKTKPFVILSGISGTGKTKVVQWFAESVGATEDNGQFVLIPIRPDWNDGSDLLGYVDIKGEFKPGPLTNVIQRAEKNPDLPYFVLLDEMNLARVEHYFSDVLSVMESRKWQGDEMVTSPLLTTEISKREIKLPTNLYILGTVNMDETTHPFSKKVLDRANTIEFNRVELANLSFLGELDEVEPIEVPNKVFQSIYLHLKDLYHGNEGFVKEVTDELVNINNILQPSNNHFGYRVRDEISFYLAYNDTSKLMDQNKAFDHCILQKILPRIAGSDERTDKLLKDLYKHFTGRVYEEQDSYYEEMNQAKYPKSAAKVLEMLRRLQDGFTSFWIS